MHRLLLAMLLLIPANLPADLARPDAKVLVQRANEQLVEQLRVAYPGYSRIEAIPVSAAPRHLSIGDEVLIRLPSDNRLQNRVCVWLDVRKNSRVVKSVPLWFEVRAYKPVAVVTRALRPKEALHDTDVTLQEREVAGLRDSPMAGLPTTNQRARRYLQSGTVLRTTDLEPQPPVLSSQRVSVRIVTGSVEIETSGIAEQEGWLGDTIRIRNVTSDASFFAQVASDSRVEVVSR